MGIHHLSTYITDNQQICSFPLDIDNPTELNTLVLDLSAVSYALATKTRWIFGLDVIGFREVAKSFVNVLKRIAGSTKRIFGVWDGGVERSKIQESVRRVEACFCDALKVSGDVCRGADIRGISMGSMSPRLTPIIFDRVLREEGIQTITAAAEADPVIQYMATVLNSIIVTNDTDMLMCQGKGVWILRDGMFLTSLASGSPFQPIRLFTRQGLLRSLGLSSNGPQSLAIFAMFMGHDRVAPDFTREMQKAVLGFNQFKVVPRHRRQRGRKKVEGEGGEGVSKEVDETQGGKEKSKRTSPKEDKAECEKEEMVERNISQMPPIFVDVLECCRAMKQFNPTSQKQTTEAVDDLLELLGYRQDTLAVQTEVLKSLDHLSWVSKASLTYHITKTFAEPSANDPEIRWALKDFKPGGVDLFPIPPRESSSKADMGDHLRGGQADDPNLCCDGNGGGGGGDYDDDALAIRALVEEVGSGPQKSFKTGEGLGIVGSLLFMESFSFLYTTHLRNSARNMIYAVTSMTKRATATFNTLAFCEHDGSSLNIRRLPLIHVEGASMEGVITSLLSPVEFWARKNDIDSMWVNTFAALRFWALGEAACPESKTFAWRQMLPPRIITEKVIDYTISRVMGLGIEQLVTSSHVSDFFRDKQSLAAFDSLLFVLLTLHIVDDIYGAECLFPIESVWRGFFDGSEVHGAMTKSLIEHPDMVAGLLKIKTS